MTKWESLPNDMKNDEVAPFYSKLCKRNATIFLKHFFDFLISFLGLLFLIIPFIFIAIFIKLDSKGPVFYRQERLTKNKRVFKIFKFRTMYLDSDKKGSLITVSNDTRITRFGKILRKYKIDELPQIINVLLGDMSFVGIRPEVQKYVDSYNQKMQSTFLLRAGITSLASIKYRNENDLIETAENPDLVYINDILPKKMELNYEYLNNLSLFLDLKCIIKTIF